jgi:hypothetical protein
MSLAGLVLIVLPIASVGWSLWLIATGVAVL